MSGGKDTPDWTNDDIKYEGVRGISPYRYVDKGYEREDILPGCDMITSPHIAVVRQVNVTCTLCKTPNITNALELDTAGAEYEVMFLCVSCARACLSKLEG